MMEEDSWVCIDESFSSDENFSDSDKVDSETEAQLYSLIHFEGNLSSLNRQSSATKNVTESDATFPLSDKMKYVLSTEKKESNSNDCLQNGTSELVRRDDNNLLKTLHENEELYSANHEVPTYVVNNSNSDMLGETQFSNDSNKRKFDHSEPNYSSPPKKAATDSGRRISECVDSSGNKDIQTNIWEDDDDDIVFISSDSETDLSPPSKKKISYQQNMSMPNMKIGEHSKDLWFVNQEDISRARNIKSRRYHDKVDITCSNCSRKGHHNRICPLPKSIKCFVCGGEHINTACNNRMCGKCYRTGHDRKSCWLSHVRSCALCHMQGHIKEYCPDLWRRYHLTTQPGKIVPDKNVKHNSSVFCCKCGRPGHFGAVCNFEQRGYKNCFPTWPNVLSYDEPYNLPVQTSNTIENKKKSKKDLVIKRKKKVLSEAERLARRAKIKQRKQERKQLKRQEFLNSKEIHKVLKEKDFPRTPKNNSAINLSNLGAETNNSTITLSSPRTSKNNSAINLSSPRTPKNNYAINLSSPRTSKNYYATNIFCSRTPKNNSVINLSSPRTKKDNSAMSPRSDSEVVILPTPKKKKNISVVDLTSPNPQKSNCAFNESCDLPESVQLMMLAQEKRREKNRKRKLKRRQNRLQVTNDSSESANAQSMSAQAKRKGKYRNQRFQKSQNHFRGREQIQSINT